ncbi:MAG TPA: site-specific integrase, partial [Planctomycetota bacterium]|nr:site-specific integrase [Planctomycetota bacterium]
MGTRYDATMESEVSQPGPSPKDGRLLDAWLKDLTFERDLSGHTQTAYRSDLHHLAQFLLTQALSLPEARAEHLIAFLHQRQEVGDGATTRARRLAALRSFYRWLKDTGRSTHNPSLLLPRGKKPELLPKSLGAPETERLIAALPEGDEPIALRDRAIIELLYGAGLRASEATGLDLRDFDDGSTLLRVLGKGRRERRVPLGTPGVAAVLRWICVGRPRLVTPKSDDALFV